MTLSSVFISRPVLASVSSIIIVLFGAIGFTFLGVREYPAVDPPVITVSTTYTGANSDVIESQITEPLEASINGIAGIRTLTSSSSDGRSQITVEFELGVDMEAAANDVRDRVSRAMRNLPRDVDPPIVSKSDADSSPIVMITLQSPTRNLLALSDFANNVFKERLQTIPGVAEIRIWGEKRYSMRLWMDPARLAAFRLTPIDVLSALNRENIELPSGRIEGRTTELTIRTLGRLKEPHEFNNLIIREDAGRVIRFEDVGYATLGVENERTNMRGQGGVPLIGVVITPQPGANHIAIADEVYKRVEQIRKDMPADITLGEGFDVTKSIRKAITEVEETILIAFILVVMVIFFFLRDWRTTLIPVIAIPISLIGTFFIMYLADFSINILTLLGVVLVTGIVVDDAIVVLENIYQKIEQGTKPMEAGHKGAQEIFFAIVSTTVTLAAVFLPIIFLQGLVGRLFREFGIVVAGAVLISAFVSLTLTPMMSARLLKRTEEENWLYRKTEPKFRAFISMYQRSLTWFMDRRWWAIAIMAVSLAIILVVGAGLSSELAPLEDRSRLQISATAPEGTGYEYMDMFMNDLQGAVEKAVPENEGILALTSPGFGSSAANSGFVRVSLVDPEGRDRTQQAIADDLGRLLRQYSEARVFVTQEQTIGVGRRGGLPVQFVIQAPDFEHLRDVIPRFLEEARQHKAFQVVDVNLKFNKPELHLAVDRDKARNLGLSMSDVAQTLQLYFSGQRMGYFIREGKQYQIIGLATRDNRDEPLDLKSLYVRAPSGELVQLDNIVRLSDESAPPQLYRYDRYIAATVSAGLAPGVTLGEGIQAMDDVAQKVLDETFRTALTGASKDFAESSSSLLFALLLALVLIYLVLAAQFESFRDPFIIMLTVPLAMAGAILSLWMFGQTLNIFSQIGIIALIGIVTKNGILIVEFSNQRQDAGKGVIEAAIEASTLRLRPILMTSLATVLGALPIALALGASAQSRVSLGIVVIGGLLFSLVLTLYVVPALYTFLSEKRHVIAIDERRTEPVVVGEHHEVLAK
ncbi:MAG: acriflavin resistance protein [Ignavibacteria bacterium GWA2_55_11]|nr:MAG: acriflavin resistance protein [Ignavibacteria bacterium GWA2_55_11]